VPHLKVLAPKPQLLNVTTGAAAILNHGTAFGIRIASFDLHRPNAGNACDEIGEEAVAFCFGFDGRHRGNYPILGSSGSFTLQRDGKGGSLFKIIFESPSSGVLTSDFPATECSRCHDRGLGKSFKRTVAPCGRVQNLLGYALAGLVASQLLRESFTRSVESDFHIRNGSFVKMIGNHFHASSRPSPRVLPGDA
jgi:hypothetical protein